MIGAVRRRIATWVASVAVAAAAFAAQASEIDLAVIEQQYNLAQTVRGGTVTARWIGDGALAFSEDNAREPGIWRVDLEDFAQRRVSAAFSLDNGRPAATAGQVYFFDGDAVSALDLASGSARDLAGAELEHVTAAQPRPFARRFPQTPDRPIYETPNWDRSVFARVDDGEIVLRGTGSAADRALTRNTPTEYVWNPLSFRFSAEGGKLAAVGDDFSAAAKLANVDWMADDFAMTPF
ncbi:MAG: hypothetical protein MI755_05275, partial [Sphingomonadales bacterium]|nr:hypothetical protein [Sphingomonadales bacterium]